MFVSCCRCVCFRLLRSGLFFCLSNRSVCFLSKSDSRRKAVGKIVVVYLVVYSSAGVNLLLFPKIIDRQRIVIITTQPSNYKYAREAIINCFNKPYNTHNIACRTTGTASSRGERYRCLNQWCITCAGRQTLVAYAKGGGILWIKCS